MAQTLTELLARCRARDDDAVSELVRRFHAWALDVASSLTKDRGLAEDVVQEAFVAALEGLPKLRDPKAFPGYLRQIVRRRAGRHNTQRREHPVGTIPDSPSREPSPSERLQQGELAEAVANALASLPPTSRETMELFYLSQWRCAEIAATLGVPQGTVKRRLHDGRKHLRYALLGHFADLEKGR